MAERCKCADRAEFHLAGFARTGFHAQAAQGYRALANRRGYLCSMRKSCLRCSVSCGTC